MDNYLQLMEILAQIDEIVQPHIDDESLLLSQDEMDVLHRYIMLARQTFQPALLEASNWVSQRVNSIVEDEGSEFIDRQAFEGLL